MVILPDDLLSHAFLPVICTTGHCLQKTFCCFRTA